MLFNRHKVYYENYDESGELFYSYNAPKKEDINAVVLPYRKRIYKELVYPFPCPTTLLITKKIFDDKKNGVYTYYSRINYRLRDCVRNGFVYNSNLTLSMHYEFNPLYFYNRSITRFFGNYAYIGPRKNLGRRKYRRAPSKFWKLCRLDEFYDFEYSNYHTGITWFEFNRFDPELNIEKYYFNTKVSVNSSGNSYKFKKYYKNIPNVAIEDDTLWSFSHRSSWLSLIFTFVLIIFIASI